MQEKNRPHVVPIEEAIRRVGPGPMVHTFMVAGNITLGADHSRDLIVADMEAYGVENSGETATAMGHSLVIRNYPLGGGRFTALFIEAESEKGT